MKYLIALYGSTKLLQKAINLLDKYIQGVILLKNINLTKENFYAFFHAIRG